MNDHAGRESACGREMGNNEFSRSGLKLNELRDLEVCYNVAVEPSLLPLNGETMHCSCFC